jgi:predicted phage terminase large subunit-like protein
MQKIEIAPQPGPQTDFLSSKADIVIYGGAAGGGKSFGLLLDPLRYMNLSPTFGGVIFRRTMVQVTNEGGLWDESMRLYPLLGARAREHTHEWKFPGGPGMSFSNLEYEKDVLNYQGSQIPWIGFDELTHFTENQFFYMMSRNRSTSGVKPRIRATCNPDPDSFVRKLIDWWIGKDGFPIKERSGKLRYFIRINDEMIWADSVEQIHEQYGHGPEIMPTSITFIPSKLDDNKILMEKDPTYAARLLALNRVDRMRLREGNWNVRASAGSLFKREWFTILDTIPASYIQQCRYWDRAATKPSESNKDPDWTRGLKMLKYPNGTFLVSDLKSTRDTPGQVENLVKTTATHDPYECTVYGEQDPGSAGVADAARFTKLLAGHDVRITKPTKDKVTRAKPVSAQAEAGNIFVLRADWNDEFFQELENFPDGAHDDIVDTLSGAFNELQGGLSILDVL